MVVRSCLVIGALVIGLAPTLGLAKAQPPTTAHAVLNLEAAGVTVPASDYAFIDGVIGEVRTRVPSPPVDRASALAALKIIDQVLVECNVIYPGRGLIEYLHEGLTERRLSVQSFQDAFNNFHNQRRRGVMLANRNRLFRVLDCDTASFVYLAVADALGWPVNLVEVPQHNFVRWTFADGSHLNFETMDGGERTDAYYVAAFAVPPSTIKPGFFMSAMSRDEVLGYVHGLRASIFARKGNFEQAKLDLVTSRRLRPVSPGPLNAEAWLYATCTPSSCRDPALAVKDASEAVSLYRSATYLDTFACALAVAGDVDRAVEIETEALTKNPDSADLLANLKAIKAGGPCLYELPAASPSTTPFNRRMGNGGSDPGDS